MVNVRRGRILIVDPDDKAVQELSSVLMCEGYDVEMNGGIKQAAKRVKDARFDCVIMDVELPEMKGYEAVSILKTIDPKIQIIMTSARNTKELEAEVRRQNVFYYYIKSFNQEELIEAVRDVLRKLGKDREVKKMNGSARILVVDDDPDFVKAVEMILKSKGYHVESACNKEDALKKIGAAAPNLILLDLMMEKLNDGFDICYKLKNDPQLRKIPILSISAITEKTGFRFSPETDGDYFPSDDYMEKPVKPEELLERVDKLLKG